MYAKFGSPRVIFKPSILGYSKTNWRAQGWGFTVERLLTGYHYKAYITQSLSYVRLLLDTYLEANLRILTLLRLELSHGTSIGTSEMLMTRWLSSGALCRGL